MTFFKMQEENFNDMLRGAERIWPMSGARAQRGRMERGAAKWRGRGLGQRNMKNSKVDNNF